MRVIIAAAVILSFVYIFHWSSSKEPQKEISIVYFDAETGQQLTAEEMRGGMWYTERFSPIINMKDPTEPVVGMSFHVIPGGGGSHLESFEIYNLGHNLGIIPGSRMTEIIGKILPHL